MLLLFRQEALDHHVARLQGDVVVPPRISHTIILGFLVTWTVAGIVWATLSHYARKETVVGWLEPENGVVRVFPEASGIIERILVKEGDLVTEGQPLALIKDNVTLGDGQQLETLLMQEHEKQRQILTDRLKHTGDASRIRELDINQRTHATEQNLDALAAMTQTLEQRHSIASSQLARAGNLNLAGHLSDTDLETARERALGLLAEKQSLSRERVNQRNAIQQLQAEKLLIATDNANAIDQLKTQLSEIDLRIVQLRGKRARIIGSPQAGVVTNLQAQEGQQLSSQNPAPLMLIVPQGTLLTAQLLVPVRAIGFVEEGQRLEVRYDAFPYQKFGLYRGEITSISRSVLMPRELQDAAFDIQEPVYKITARLQEQHISGYGKELQLKSGMTLSADIRLDDRSLLEWALDPIYTLKGKL